MNRKNIGVIVPILIVVELSFLFLTCMSYSNKDVDKIKEVYKVDKKMFAMYVINESTGKYDEIKDSDSFPSGNYKINKNKSTCVDNKGNSVTTDIMTYNDNKLTVTSNKTVFCYLYFDIKADISVTVSTDGVSGVLPTNGIYKNTISCNSATATYNQKYQRLEFSSVTSDEVKCNLNYIKDTITYPTLKSIVEENASDLGSATRFDVNSDATYTILSDSELSGNYTMFIGSSSSTSGTTTTDSFELSNGVFTSIPANLTTNTYYHVLYTIPSGTNDANYQVCYTIPKSGDGYSTLNGLYIYKGSTNALGTSYISLSSTARTDVCSDIGVMSAGEKINITQKAYTTIAPISFYIKKTEDFQSVPFALGHRYTGKQPNNWIWFNNEMWRIIGSVPVCMNADCSTKENLVKIIRAESIGGLAFHSAGSNTTWGNNTLYTLLNTKYYGKLDATGASPCFGYSSSGYALCNYTENGISSDTSDYYSRMIKEVYWNVGTVSSISTTIAAAYGLENATVSSVSGRIGLMSASDYGYASGQTTAGLSSLEIYEQTNWLYGQGAEWTLTPNSLSDVMYVYDSGNVGNYNAVYGNSVRPVLYLDSTVYVINGEEENIGTISNPYQIAK